MQCAKVLGLKKDRKSGHYMREVTPGLEDSIHFFFKPYSGKAVSVSFIVGIYLNNTSVKIYRTKKLNNGSRVTGSAI